MMKIKKILLLCLLPLLAEVLLACCNCRDIVTYEYNYDKLSIRNLDNSGKNAIETSASEVAKAAYGIRLRITTLETAELPDRNNSFFLSSANAMNCNCPPPYRSDEYILSFKIVTVNDFDETHKAGSDVTDYFQTFNGAYRKISLTDYVDEFYFDEQNNIKLDMLLMNKPTLTAQQFRVEIKFDDGRELKETTSLINLI